MRTGHGIVIDDEERPAKKALQQSLEVAFTRAEEKNRELVSCGERTISPAAVCRLTVYPSGSLRGEPKG